MKDELVNSTKYTTADNLNTKYGKILSKNVDNYAISYIDTMNIKWYKNGEFLIE